MAPFSAVPNRNGRNAGVDKAAHLLQAAQKTAVPKINANNNIYQAVTILKTEVMERETRVSRSITSVFKIVTA